MKKLTLVLLTMILTLNLFGCAQGTNDNTSSTPTDKVKIAIVQPMTHTSLDEIRDTIVAELKAKGYDDSKAEIILKNANGDNSLLSSIFTSLISDGVDLLIPIATGTAQVAASSTTEIPIVFSAVSNPVEAKLVESFDKTDKNITGVSNSIPIDQIFKLALEVTPNVKTFGFIYNTSEINSTTGITKAKAYCDANGLKYKEATITGTGDVQQAAASLAGSVDAYFTPNDNTVASAMATYVQVATDAKKPIYVGADSMVKDGGLATVGIDYTVLGKQTAEMAIKVLKGTKISEIPVEAIKDYAKMINVKTAASLNITLSDSIKSQYKLIGA